MEDKSEPIILGRPFLDTARAVIDVQDEAIILKNYKKCKKKSIVICRTFRINSIQERDKYNRQ